MKLHVSLFVFALLQLVVAIAEEESETNGLRGSLSQSMDTGSASNKGDRKLRPVGYPAPPRRPGQSQRYGLNSLLGYRPYRNTFQQPQGNFQQQGQFIGVNRGFRGPRGNRRGPQRPQDVNGDGIPDGALIVGIPRNPNSLAERLGYFRIDPGTPNVFAQGGASAPRRPPTLTPTQAPEPTVSPMPTGTPTPPPTGTPTLRPTAGPTDLPTTKPTAQPTLKPSKNPTFPPTRKPTNEPSNKPTRNPTRQPTRKPTDNPTPAAAF